MTDRRNKWTAEEIEFLKANYEFRGVEYVANKLTRHTKASISKRAQRYGIKVDQANYYYNEDEIRNIVAESFSYSEVFRKLNKSVSGDAYKYLIKYVRKRNISTEHFDPWKNNKGSQIAKPIADWLQIGTIIGSRSLKDKLYKEGLKQPICELCGQDEWWHGKRMSLILDHINGINNDNRFGNLRIVCPNCEGTLETHCRGSKAKK